MSLLSSYLMQINIILALTPEYCYFPYRYTSMAMHHIVNSYPSVESSQMSIEYYLMKANEELAKCMNRGEE